MFLFKIILKQFKRNFKRVPERTTDHKQATGKLYHLRLQVESTLFEIYKAGREPTPYW
jgi:23S rRNA maturation-related 3'-5' exoribonuclease YhaM